ncbi:hypothetical protein BD779DRAFT_1614914 [Infundibulicybe gibba]|nr:hypothetical protein BD779DRAFT_1614914 [Infundibulicybe gibba]
MDYDRKSAVSSFYGGRKSSLDALNQDFPSPNPVPDQRRDDASSFFNPQRQSRGSVDILNNGRTSTAGYNQGSFFHAGREEPLKGGRDEEEEGMRGGDDWDVYADFNNAGPRYSTGFGSGDQGATGPVELVTVPALGPEWRRSEMRDMTKSGRREKKSDARKEKWTQWKRGERGMCGKYFTRRVLVFTLFALCAAVAIVLAFTIPRVPGFAFKSDSPLLNATGSWKNAVPTTFSRFPTNFSFPAFASLQIDTNGNFLPLTFDHLHASIFDLDTGRQVGTGDMSHKTLPAKSFPQIQLPLNFTYTAANDSDQTWLNWYNACKNRALIVGGVRPPVKFRLVLDMDIAGLPTEHHASTQLSQNGV